MTMKRTGFKRPTLADHAKALQAKPKEAKPEKGARQKKCANRACRAPYLPDAKQPWKNWCSDDCALVIALDKLAKQKAAKAKKERAEDRKCKEALKSRSDWIRDAQAAVNLYVRTRDSGLPCISCGVSYPVDRTDVWDAGHFRSAGSSPCTRFNTLNIHKQCVKCNQHLSSNAVKYRIGLIEKIGLGAVEKIESDNRVRKFSVDYLVRLRNVFRRRARHIISLRERVHGEGKSRS